MSLLNEVEALYDLLSLFADDTPCRYDAQGSCLEHGMAYYKAGEECPQAILRRLLGDDIEGTRGSNSEVEGGKAP